MLYEKLHLFIYKKEHCYKSLYLSAVLVLISLLAFFELAKKVYQVNGYMISLQ
jgi:hypothetical protein